MYTALASNMKTKYELELRAAREATLRARETARLLAAQTPLWASPAPVPLAPSAPASDIGARIAALKTKLASPLPEASSLSTISPMQAQIAALETQLASPLPEASPQSTISPLQAQIAALETQIHNESAPAVAAMAPSAVAADINLWRNGIGAEAAPDIDAQIADLQAQLAAGVTPVAVAVPSSPELTPTELSLQMQIAALRARLTSSAGEAPVVAAAATAAALDAQIAVI
jgi:hypothetical protein